MHSKKYFIYHVPLVLCLLFYLNISAQHSLSNITNSMVKLRVLTTSSAVDKDGIVEKKYEWGCGFYISENGLILTAFHVIENASKTNREPINCYELASGDSKGVWIVYKDIDSDIAILQNEKYSGSEKNKYYINIIGNASELSIGMNCFSIGFPTEVLNFKNLYAISPGKIVSLDKNLKGSGKIPWRRNLLVAQCEVSNGFSGGLLFDNELLPIGIILGMYSDRDKNVFALIKRIKDVRNIIKGKQIEGF